MQNKLGALPLRGSWRSLIAALALVQFSTLAGAAPQATLIPYWQSHDPQSTLRLNHGAWNQLLQRYTIRDQTGVMLFNYAAVSQQDRLALQHYLKTLQSTDPLTLQRNEQFAFWVNLYNALTIELVLRHFPVDSIKDTADGWFSFGPWDDPLARVNGRPLTLNNIEHGILRPIWKDPRIHYVVNCASYSCPDLPVPAIDPDHIEQQLDSAARAYVNHPRGVQFKDGGDLVLSRIYDWYAQDFGNSSADLLSHLKRYANPSTAARLEGFSGSIDYEYDWSLNAP